MRHFFGVILGLGLLLAGTAVHDTAQAQDLAKPKGPVLLTVSGAVAKTNRGPSNDFEDGLLNSHGIAFQKAAAFDLAMLEGLGMKKFSLQYPGWPKRYTFEGPLLRDLLAAVGAEKSSVIRFMGLDGYEPEIPVQDARDYDVMLAIKVDGRYLGIGDRGPIWLVYPRDDVPALKNTDDAKWVWAGFHIAVE